MSAEHYFGGGARLAAKLCCGDPYAGAKLFDCLFTEDEKGRIYPAGRQASALVDSLLHSLRGAECVTGVKISKIIKENGGFAVYEDKRLSAKRNLLHFARAARRKSSLKRTAPHTRWQPRSVIRLRRCIRRLFSLKRIQSI